MAVPMFLKSTKALLETSRNAVATGLVLVAAAIGLLSMLVLTRSEGNDVKAAFAFAAGYLLTAGVSLIRRSFPM